MNLAELITFIVLVAFSLAISGWLRGLLGMPAWVFVLPVFLAAFYLLNWIRTWMWIGGSAARRHEQLGSTWFGKRRYARAAEEYTQALAAGSELPWRVHQSRALAYEHLEDYDRAIADYDEVLALNPGDAFAHVRRGALYQRKGEYDQAIADITEGVAGEPDYAEAYFERALAYEGLGRYREALADLDRCLSLRAPPPAAYYHKAAMHERLGELQQALAVYREFLKTAPRRHPSRAQARERVEQLQSR